MYSGNGLFSSEKAVETVIPLEVVSLQLSKCKNWSSPGVSGISYKLLKLIFKYDSEFMTRAVNDVVNDRTNCDVLSEMIVIPI